LLFCKIEFIFEPDRAPPYGKRAGGSSFGLVPERGNMVRSPFIRKTIDAGIGGKKRAKFCSVGLFRLFYTVYISVFFQPGDSLFIIILSVRPGKCSECRLVQPGIMRGSPTAVYY
jgi:hypothetical protein